MVEKITVSPQEVRGYGNVANDKDLEDYSNYRCDMSEGSEVIKGVEEKVFTVEASPAPSLSISNATESPVGGRLIQISASLKNEDNDNLVGRAVSLNEGDVLLASAITGESTTFAVVLDSSAHQLHAVFDGDDENPPAVSESIQVFPAKPFWDVEHEFDEDEYAVGDDLLLTGTVGTLYDEIVDGEIVTGRVLEPGIRVALMTGSQNLTCNADNGGNFEFQITNLQSNRFRMIIQSDSMHRAFNNFIDVPVHSYRLGISSTVDSTDGSAVLVVGLTDFSSEVEGATVRITGSDGSSYACVTDSIGEGRVNVGNLSDAVTYTASYGNVSSSVLVEPPLDWYDASNYTSGSGRMPASRASSIYLQSVGGRWLNREFTDKEYYTLEFDLILTKNNREGFYFGANPNSDTNSGISVYKDVGNTMIETFDSTGTAIRLESSLPSNYFNTGTHRIMIMRDGDVAYIYFDDTLIFEFDAEVLSYGAEERIYNTVGLLTWGTGTIEFGNFELDEWI